jgi:hypothetical protein
MGGPQALPPQGMPPQGAPVQGQQPGSGIEDKIVQFAQSLTAEEQVAALPILQAFMQEVQGREAGGSDAELLKYALQRSPSQA